MYFFFFKCIIITKPYFYIYIYMYIIFFLFLKDGLNIILYYYNVLLVINGEGGYLIVEVKLYFFF